MVESGHHQFAVVGGVAVALRLAQAAQSGGAAFDVRATEDLDAVVRVVDRISPHDDLVTVNVAAALDDDLLIDGVRVQTIPVHPVADKDLQELPPKDVLFVGGHWYAAESAGQLSANAGETTALVPVAAPSALFVTKLHAAIDRRDVRPQKRASDFVDIHHLLVAFDHDGSVAVELGKHPLLARAVATIAEQFLVQEAARSARAVRVWGDPSIEALTPDDLRDVGHGLLARLRDQMRT